MISEQNSGEILIVLRRLTIYAIKEQYIEGKYIDFYSKYTKSTVDSHSIGLPIAWQ